MIQKESVNYMGFDLRQKNSMDFAKIILLSIMSLAYILKDDISKCFDTRCLKFWALQFQFKSLTVKIMEAFTSSYHLELRTHRFSAHLLVVGYYQFPVPEDVPGNIECTSMAKDHSINCCLPYRLQAKDSLHI